MKYALVFFLLNSSLLVQLSYSQSLYTPNGTIGVSINNNIGIGTTSPNGNLHLYGKSAGNGNVLSSLVLGKAIGVEIQAIQEYTDDDVQGMAFRVKSSNVSGDPNFEAMRLTKDGNLGIGTTSPNGNLHLYGKSAGNGNVLSSLVLGKAIGVEIQAIQEYTDDDVQGMAFRVKSSNVSGDPNFEAMRLTKDGNLGIGTTSPNGNLHLYGKSAGNGNVLSSLVLGKAIGVEIQAIQEYTDDDVQGIAFRVKSSNVSGDPNFEAMRLTKDGNLGIGTTKPDTKLAVKGTIHSEEVKVDLNVPGPDYVFESDYKLRTLKETKEYISENKHLPEIPSAKEMKVNGIELGDMNMRLLKKIEELTLYQIELFEKIEELHKKVEELEK